VEHQAQEHGLRQPYYDWLSDPGIYQIFKVQNRWLTLQQTAEYAGATTLPGITGRAAGVAAKPHAGEMTRYRYYLALLFNHVCMATEAASRRS